MVKSRVGRAKARSDKCDQQAPAERATHQDFTTNGFDKALKALGHTSKQSVLVEIQSFLKDWRSGVSDAELRSCWKCRPAKGKDASKYVVMHFYVCKNYRVDFTVMPTDPPGIWFLNVYRRTTTSDQDIDDSIVRAGAIWKKEQMV